MSQNIFNPQNNNPIFEFQGSEYKELLSFEQFSEVTELFKTEQELDDAYMMYQAHSDSEVVLYKGFATVAQEMPEKALETVVDGSLESCNVALETFFEMARKAKCESTTIQAIVYGRFIVNRFEYGKRNHVLEKVSEKLASLEKVCEFNGVSILDLSKND